jgi:hypothetical protein
MSKEIQDRLDAIALRQITLIERIQERIEANSPSSNLIARNEDAYLQMLANAFYGLSVLHSVETGSEEVVPPLTFGESLSE